MRADGNPEPRPISGLKKNTGIVSGTYTTEYAPETEPGTRVIATAYDSRQIPAHFTVYTKSGQILEFGVTEDSRIEAQGSTTPRLWAVNKISDRAGNYLTVSYTETNANGEYYPSRIDYTGNANSGIAPYSSVQFVYEARPDITPVYQAGSLMRSTVRMVRVQTYAGTAVVKDYRLAYDVSSTANRSRLTSLTECAGDGTCLPGTIFGWQQGSLANFTSEYFSHAGIAGFDLLSANDRIIPFDYNGDGKSDLAIYRPGSGAISNARSDGLIPDLLTIVTNGRGTTTAIYKSLTDPTIYTKDTTATYPTLDLQAPIYVVSSTATSNGIGGTRTTNYTYGGAKADLSGRGMLGFRWMRVVDQDTGITSYTEYSQTYPYIGMPIRSQRSLNGIVLNDSTATLASIALGGTRYFPYVSRSVEQSFETNGAFVSTRITDSSYDNFGNPTQITVSSHDGYIKTTTSTYDNDVSNWILGRLRTAQVKSTVPNGSFAIRNSSFAYNPTNGLLVQEVIEPGTPYALTTDYGYDAFGNKTSATVSGPDIASRTTTTTYDAQGRFPIKTTNALGHTETRAFDSRFGKVTSLTGPNGLTTTWTYDSFGRKTSETRADGTKTTWALAWCDTSCPQWGKYYSTVTNAGAPTAWTFYDSLNREIRQQTQGFDSGLIAKDTQYNALGQVSSVSRPFKSGSAVQWSTSVYDGIGRLVQVTGPDGSVTRTDYSGLTETITNALGQVTTRVKNSQGQLVQVTDALGSVTRYTYDAFGNLTQTLDPANNAIRMQYDGRGRKISMTDPDMGYWRYAYNALGELISQTDAKNQVVTMQYDKLGRMIQRSEPDLIGTWEYDTAANGIGKLVESMRRKSMGSDSIDS